MWGGTGSVAGRGVGVVGAKPRARHLPSRQVSPQKGRPVPLHHLLRPTCTLWAQSPDASLFVPLKRRLALGRSSWYPKETLVSCILVLASNSTPTCSWRGHDEAQQSASPAGPPGSCQAWGGRGRSLTAYARTACPHHGSRSGSPGHWLCGSRWHACPPGPGLPSPTSCSL